jgi:hypothetical protein
MDTNQNPQTGEPDTASLSRRFPWAWPEALGHLVAVQGRINHLAKKATYRERDNLPNTKEQEEKAALEFLVDLISKKMVPTTVVVQRRS